MYWTRRTGSRADYYRLWIVNEFASEHSMLGLDTGSQNFGNGSCNSLSCSGFAFCALCLPHILQYDCVVENGQWLYM